MWEKDETKKRAWIVTRSFTGHLIKPFVTRNKWVTSDDETGTSTPVLFVDVRESKWGYYFTVTG